MSDADLEYVFSVLDTDCSGSIEVQELVAFLKKPKSEVPAPCVAPQALAHRFFWLDVVSHASLEGRKTFFFGTVWPDTQHGAAVFSSISHGRGRGTVSLCSRGADQAAGRPVCPSTRPAVCSTVWGAVTQLQGNYAVAVSKSGIQCIQ